MTIDPESQQFHTNFLSLDTLLQRFIANLLPPDHALGTLLDHQLCLHLLARAAEIQLHFPFASQSVSCRTRIFTSAKAMVLLIDTWEHVLSMEYINPMLAVSLFQTMEIFFFTDLRRLFGLSLAKYSSTRTFESNMRSRPPYANALWM